MVPAEQRVGVAMIDREETLVGAGQDKGHCVQDTADGPAKRLQAALATLVGWWRHLLGLQEH